MTNSPSVLIEQAERTASSLRFWWLLYWTIYNWFGFLSWLVAIVVPFGLAVLLYLPHGESRVWNIALLAISAFGLVLQVLANVMRFRERAVLGRRNAARLEVAILKYREGQFDNKALLQELNVVLESGCDEPGP